jgi:hypothetical protein
VARHHPQLRDGTAETIRGGAGRIGVRQTVEAEPLHRPVFAPSLGSVRSRRPASSRERGVEAGDVRNVGQEFARLADQLHDARLVQRRERGECEQPSLHVVVDHDGFREFRAAVHDPVPDGRDPVVGRNERREVVLFGGRDDVVAVEDGQLQAARTC